MTTFKLFWKWIELKRFLLRTCARRNRLNHDRIILDLTFDCNLMCDNCNRSCGLAPSSDTLSVDQVRRFLQESVHSGRKWTHIMLEGGEPTLHPHLMDIIDLLVSFRSGYSPSTEIVLCTNGYAPDVGSILARVPQSVQVYNSQKRGRVHPSFDSFHQAPRDDPSYRDADFTRACHIPTMWGLCLNRYGYYPCSPSAGIDRVLGLNLGRRTLPSPDEPLHRELDALCRWCGHFKRFNRAEGSLRLSESWQRVLDDYRDHVPELTLY
jgi:hypothetical protein